MLLAKLGGWLVVAVCCWPTAVVGGADLEQFAQFAQSIVFKEVIALVSTIST